MNPQKLDSALLGELARADGGRYAVLVRTRPKLAAASQQTLRRCGAREDPTRSTVFCLDLDRAQVEELSGEDWVLTIRLTRKLRPLE